MDEKEKKGFFGKMSGMMSGCCQKMPDFSSCCPPAKEEKTENGKGDSTDDKSEKKEE